MEFSSEGGSDEWLHDASVLEGVEVPGPGIIAIREHRVDWVVGLYEPRLERPPSAGEQNLMAEGDENENWDSDAGEREMEFRPIEIPMFQPTGAPAHEAANAPLPCLSRSARRRARRYNPNRHFEREDYVSARAYSPSSEEAGPPINRPQGQRAIEPPLARGAEPRAAQRQGPVRVRLGGIIFAQCPSTPRLIPPPFTASTAGSRATARGSARGQKCCTTAGTVVGTENSFGGTSHTSASTNASSSSRGGRLYEWKVSDRRHCATSSSSLSSSG